MKVGKDEVVEEDMVIFWIVRSLGFFSGIFFRVLYMFVCVCFNFLVFLFFYVWNRGVNIYLMRFWGGEIEWSYIKCLKKVFGIGWGFC